MRLSEDIVDNIKASMFTSGVIVITAGMMMLKAYYVPRLYVLALKIIG